MTQKINRIKINGKRLNESILKIAKIGKTNLGGSCREAFSNEDKPN